MSIFFKTKAPILMQKESTAHWLQGWEEAFCYNVIIHATDQPQEENVLEKELSVLLKAVTIEGHVKAGLNGGTLGTGIVPAMIWQISCV